MTDNVLISDDVLFVGKKFLNQLLRTHIQAYSESTKDRVNLGAYRWTVRPAVDSYIQYVFGSQALEVTRSIPNIKLVW